MATGLMKSECSADCMFKRGFVVYTGFGLGLVVLNAVPALPFFQTQFSLPQIASRHKFQATSNIFRAKLIGELQTQRSGEF